MSTLLIGFDSAWTPTHSGGIVGALRHDDGSYRELGPPKVVNYERSECIILELQSEYAPLSTIIALDQPIIVPNATGQRPVEHLVGSPVGARNGGVLSSNTGIRSMFGGEAPVWQFLSQFGGAADPLGFAPGTRVFETYPVLAMIALGWMVIDARPTGRLPKYNPKRRNAFAIDEWRHVCALASTELQRRGLTETAAWVDAIAQKDKPRKHDQDCLDACLCLLVAVHLIEGDECLMVGDLATGYILVPDSEVLRLELETRCSVTGRAHAEWVRVFRFLAPA